MHKQKTVLKEHKRKKKFNERVRKMNMLDIQGHTKRELVIMCSHTLTNYITEEGVEKEKKVRHFDRLSFYE
jgi:hypothetical protein